MAIKDNEPVPTFFAENFASMDESDATSADFQAPKKENRYCLVEMSKEMLEAFEAGQLFHIKEHSMGQKGGAALSTDSQTWGLEFLENSNPTYLGRIAELPNAVGGKEAEVSENKDPNAPAVAEADKKVAVPSKQCTIFAQCRGHVLLKPLSCDSQRVRDLLAPHSVDSETQDSSSGAASGAQPLTTSQLQFKVAASPKELQKVLEEGPYVERDGAWRWMPAVFEREVTDVALNLISLHKWDQAAVDVKALLKAVQQHFGEDGARHVPSSAVLLNALRGITSGADTSQASDKASAEAPTNQAGRLKLDVEKIKLFQAMQLLRESPSRLRERFELPAVASRPKRPRLGGPGAAAPAGGRDVALQIEEFCAAFSALTSIETTIDELGKIVGDCMYIDEMEGSVHVLDATTLPQEPRERLKRLFELSSHWKPERIAALMAPAVKGAKIDAWLLKTTKTVYIEFEKGKEMRMLTKKFGF